MKAISPKVWGESAWIILHRLSFLIKSAAEVNTLFECLKVILPCPKCRNNLEMHLKKCPPPHTLSEIPEFIYKLHKRVNDSIENKQKSCITFHQVENLYNPMGHASHAGRAGRAMNDKEWIFIEAIIDVHKGYYKETDQYISSLKLFLDLWVKYTSGIITPFTDTSSKRVLKEWLHKNKKGALMHFNECSV